MGAGSKHLAKRADDRRALAEQPPGGGGSIAVAFGRTAPQPSALRWQVQDFADPTWSQVYAALRACERGDTVAFSHLTRRMLKSDDTMLAAYESRRSAVAALPYECKAASDEDRDKLAADDVAAMIDSLPISRIVLDLLDGWFTGWSVAEIVWEARGAWVWPVAVDWLAPYRLRFDDAFAPYLYDNGLLMSDGDTRVGRLGRALTPRKYLVHVPRAIPDYPVSSGVALACVRPWWVKLTATKYWLSGAEWAGNPRAVGKYPQHASDDVKEAMYQAIEAMAADTPVVMSNESTLDLLAPLAQGGNSIWSELASRCDAAIVKAIMGSTLNVEIGSVGSRAAATSQADETIAPRLRRDSAAVWETITRDLVRPFLELNAWRYGGVPRTPWLSHVFTESPSPVVDDLLVDVGGATVDEVRVAKGLEAWGPERGGDRVATRAQTAPAAPFTDTPSAPVVEAGAPGPFSRPLTDRPWETAMRMAAATAIRGTAATATSTPSQTTPPGGKRSA